jgi:3-oxoacyl-[acyl-carrier-protein] synthase-3
MNHRSNPKAIITAMGHFHPEHALPNSFFDSLDIESDAEWIADRTGILERRSILSKEDVIALRHGRTTLEELRKLGRVTSIADMSEKAWESLQSRAGGSATDVDGLICGTSIPDYDIPANACTISAKLGFACPSFDVNSACSSFVFDLHVARSLVSSQMHRKMAIFNVERYSLRMDYSDKRTCILFGDGCASTIVEGYDEAKSGLEVVDTLLASDPSKYDTVCIADSEFFWQNGKAVQKFAITRTLEVTQQILERNGFTNSDISYFIGHQANLRMVSSVADRLGLSPDQHLHNVSLLGNQGGAGAPAVLSMNWEKFKKGDLIVIAVVGSGLSWGATLLRKI